MANMSDFCLLYLKIIIFRAHPLNPTKFKQHSTHHTYGRGVHTGLLFQHL